MPDRPLRTLLVDDEGPARQRLRRLLAPLDEVGEIEEAEDGVAALAALSRAPFDLVFLDVRMPEMDGFAVLDRLPPEARPAVVFTTAYDEYAVDAFRSNAVDYLLKPVEAERLREAVARVDRRREQHEGAAYVDRLAELLESMEPPPARAPSGPYLQQLSVQGRDRLLVLPTDDLLAAEVQDGITNLHVLPPGEAAPHRHIVSFTLDALEARLDPEAFMRVHRGVLVNLRRIREMIPWFSGRYKLVLDGGHEVVASRARSRELRDRFSL